MIDHEYPKISLAAARVNKGLTLRESAKFLGITPQTLSSYENGKTSPTYPIAKQMSDLYEFPLDYLRISNG